MPLSCVCALKLGFCPFEKTAPFIDFMHVWAVFIFMMPFHVFRWCRARLRCLIHRPRHWSYRASWPSQWRTERSARDPRRRQHMRRAPQGRMLFFSAKNSGRAGPKWSKGSGDDQVMCFQVFHGASHPWEKELVKRKKTRGPKEMFQMGLMASLANRDSQNQQLQVTFFQ